MKGFKQAAIAFIEEMLTRQGYGGREVYKAERLGARDLTWWDKKARIKNERCQICGRMMVDGHFVSVENIAVSTRLERSSYASRKFWFLHKSCLKEWADKHPELLKKLKTPAKTG